MSKRNIYIGNNPITGETKEVTGKFVDIDNEKYYRISHFDRMPDFFMTIVSHSDHWMYLSSNGALTAGRKNRDNALFPYYTVDKIHDSRNRTGSKTWCLVEKKDRTYLWEPFTDESEKTYRISRNIYKSIYGNKVIFEEINEDLGCSFLYGWYNSERFGWIKKSIIRSHHEGRQKISVLDGIRNIMPYGINYAFQNEYSNLSDAYKKSELLPESKLGLFILSSIPVDRAEPSEALKATTVWSWCQDEGLAYLISDRQIENFKAGIALEPETDIRASKGSYYIQGDFHLESGEEKEWYFMAEINQDAMAVANLDYFIRTSSHIDRQIHEDIAQGTRDLVKIVSGADGLQAGREELCYARHFSNTLFNVMRGGIFDDNYRVNRDDFILYLRQTNAEIFASFRDVILELPRELNYSELIEWGKNTDNVDLERICTEYLPLTFSRRHGDPSRPWNQFSIELKNEDGSKKLSYEGNWRDIFQNWEALSLAYPVYLEGMISKFLNASTADGYNPYRITRTGIDWESPDPHDPWAYIGYWGDHQIIYLQKFLELSHDFAPGKLRDLLNKEVFTFANVPYRIKPFDQMEKNPKDTISFDHELNEKIQAYVKEIGADAKLLRKADNSLVRANLAEKILVTLLAKLSNFIPEAGIWLNTQRPEWNDANNALVGNGVSMVTLYYIRRMLQFWEQRLKEYDPAGLTVATEIKSHFDQTLAVFEQYKKVADSGFSPAQRYQFTRALGMAGSQYRENLYTNRFSGFRTTLSTETLVGFIGLVLHYIDRSIEKNKRDDGLYHAYNLVSFNNQQIAIRYLYEMLEGQVAVLSSGYLDASHSLAVLEALKKSRLFRTDQYSYLLYPDRQLPRFTEKNNIPEEKLKESVLLNEWLKQDHNPIVQKDLYGLVHFNGAFRNASVLEAELDKLEAEKPGLFTPQDRQKVLEIYETVFDHQSFTGRSGTFYGYEGLGSIYWHMVSKLLLATQECYFHGIDQGADRVIVDKIKDHYYEIKAGIGLYKSPALYGAFPTDAYSHTPANAGAKQPGLTGQVKEDVLSRMYEMGIHIKNGQVSFRPSLINHTELLEEDTLFRYYDPAGHEQTVTLGKGQIAYTFCQVPIIYQAAHEEKIRIDYSNGHRQEITGHTLPAKESEDLFKRTMHISRISFFHPLT